MSERMWTEEQKNAINAESGTLLVSAGAGSGKTSVLVERIVRKLTDENTPCTPESLLVVTFTNAAAAEMRARIYKRTSEKMYGEPHRREFYTRLLAEMGDMKVCTMDAFCMSLVREYGHSVGIEPDFRLLDSAESEKIKNEAVQKICEERFAEGKKAFLQLAGLFDSGINDDALAAAIKKLSDFAMSNACPDAWLDTAAAHFSPCSAENSVWGKIIKENAAAEISFAEELLKSADADLSCDEELQSALSPILNEDIRTVRLVSEGIKNKGWDEISACIFKALADIKSRRFRAPNGYTDNPQKKAAAAKRDEVKDILEKLSSIMCCTEAENASDMQLLREAAGEAVKTVKEYNSLIAQIKKDAEAYDFSDILHFALALLLDSSAEDGKTALARELSDGISEILIDEYQDTNHAQDTLFTAISKNGENMFMVGDVKQSIYRFRLACPEIFTEKFESFPYYDGKAVKSKIILGKNFRSRRGIIDFVNFMFTSLISKECGELEYNEDEKLKFGAEYYPETGCADAEACIIETDGEKSFAAEAAFIAAEIKKLNGNTLIFESGAYRKAVPSDFCILLRSPSSCAHYYIDELKRAGLPAAADSLESFFDTAEIKTAAAYLKAIDNPSRDIYLLAVMLSPVFGFSPDDAARLRTSCGRDSDLYSCALRAAAGGNKKCLMLTQKIDRFKKLSAVSTVGGLIREIYADSLYPETAGSGENGEAKKNNLRLFLDLAEKKDSEAGTDLSGFIRYIDMLAENGDSPSSGSLSGTGVRIMSMHRSKGLEFPYVFIAGTGKDFNKNDLRSNMLISSEYGLGFKIREKENIKLYDTLSSSALKLKLNGQQLSEEMRIYYVAATRAKEKLYIVAGLNNSEKRLSEAEYFLDGSKKVPAHFVKNSSSALKWIYSALLRHPDGGELRKEARYSFTDESRASIKLIKDFSAQKAQSAEEKPAEADSKIIDEIRKRAAFSYEFAPIASASSKHAASALNSEHFDSSRFGKSVPGFMFSSELSPEDTGTATHIFLQFCNFDICRNDVQSEKNRLVSEGRLNEKQAAAVDLDAIEAFMHSNIIKRIDKAQSVMREKKFTLSKSICDLDKNIPEKFRNEKTVVIGKIDLFFVEDGGGVIVDYKTDSVKELSVLKERYNAQMSIYREAVEAAENIRVKECILYSLKLKKYISIF